jgi:hypothetical protein
MFAVFQSEVVVERNASSDFDPQTRLSLRARPAVQQGEAAWGTSGQVSQIFPVPSAGATPDKPEITN